jgi:hypothetical protein
MASSNARAAHHDVIMVFDFVKPDLVTNMHMELTTTSDDALHRACDMQGRGSEVGVFPHKLSVIVD